MLAWAAWRLAAVVGAYEGWTVNLPVHSVNARSDPRHITPDSNDKGLSGFKTEA